MPTYLINEDLRTALINYLGTRPINEALPLFAALQRLQATPAVDPRPQPEGVDSGQPI